MAAAWKPVNGWAGIVRVTRTTGLNWYIDPLPIDLAYVDVGLPDGTAVNQRLELSPGDLDEIAANIERYGVGSGPVKP